MNRKGAIFLDRDGTLIEEVEFLSRPDQVRLFPSSAKAVRLLNLSGLRVILATNQSGIARGYFDLGTLREIHLVLEELLRAEGAALDAIYYCPHHPKGKFQPYSKICHCRKPESGLFKQAALDLNIELTESVTIGDSLRDIQAGKAVGTHGVLVETGYGKREISRLEEIENPPKFSSPDFVASDILQAARWALEKIGS